MYIFNIDTGPLPLDQIRDLIPPFAPKLADPGVFDPLSVKYGQTKDEEKRAKKLAECQAKHAEAISEYELELATGEEAYYANALENAAKSALTGRVLCIGVTDAASNKTGILQNITSDDAGERKVLADFWRIVNRAIELNRNIVGFNCHNFDWPFVLQRSFLLDVDCPKLIEKGKYLPHWAVDLMTEWSCGQRGGNGYMKLDTLARAMGFEGKTDSGKNFAKLWAEDRKQAIDYEISNLASATAIARRMGVS